MMSSERHVKVFKDDAGEWRWTAYDRNGQAVATCGEGYVNKAHASDMAYKENENATISIEDSSDGGEA